MTDLLGREGVLFEELSSVLPISFLIVVVSSFKALTLTLVSGITTVGLFSFLASFTAEPLVSVPPPLLSSGGKGSPLRL